MDWLFCVPQIIRDAITTPKTIVCPTIPGNLAPASGKNTSSDVFSNSNKAGSITIFPTANKNAFGTRCPSTFERTLVVTV